MKPILLLSILLCSTPVFAQATYADGSAGPGGFTPELSCPSAWLGRPSFGFQLDSGLGGAPAHLGISYATGSSVMYGAPVSIDVSQLYTTVTQTLSGPAGTPGAGSTYFAMNLPPASPSLFGMTVYVQAGVLDQGTGVMAASNAIRLTLSMEPELFVGGSIIGGSPWYLVDGQSHAITDSGTFSVGASGSAYTNGGQDLFVAVSQTGIEHADLRGSTSAWSTLWSSAGLLFSIELDVERQRMWTLEGAIGSSNRELVCIDFDSSSPTYGQQIAITSGAGATGWVELWGLSNDGTRAAVMSVFTSDVYIWDLDPASPTYLTQIQSMTVPGSGSWPLNTQVAFSANDSELIVTIQYNGTANAEIARWSFDTSSWIDHNASLAGQQHLGDFSDPPILFGSAPTSLDVAPSGSWLIASGFGGSGWLGRLDFTSGSGTGYTWTPVTSSVSNAWKCTLDSGGDVIAVSTGYDAAGDVQFFDANTLLRLGGTFLSINQNLYELSLR